MAVFRMFDFSRGSALDPSRELIALPQTPEPIAGFTRAYFWLHTSLSLTKNYVVFSLGQTDRHCYHDSLNMPKTFSWMENCTKCGHLILRKIIEYCYHQMSYFEVKMHQIRFRLELRPRPRWGEVTALPRPPAGIEGAYF